MTEKQSQDLNYFFVNTFNQILAWEERALQKAELKNLSVKELHILEATAALEVSDQNTMSLIADRINISVGALTTGVNTLVKKEYLRRGSDSKDRRIVKIFLTETGQFALAKHEAFHQEMIKEVGNVLDESSIDTLTDSLKQLSKFFETYRR